MEAMVFLRKAHLRLVKMPWIGPMKAHTKVPIAHNPAFLRNNPEKAQRRCYKKENLLFVKGRTGMK
jgi:hypothetical protein